MRTMNGHCGGSSIKVHSESMKLRYHLSSASYLSDLCTEGKELEGQSVPVQIAAFYSETFVC